MRLRRMDVTHADEIAELHIQVERETYQATIPELISHVSKIENRREIWRISLDDKRICTIAIYVDGKKDPIGFITGIVDAQANKNATKLSAIYVIRDYQGLGNGKLLLASFIRSATEVGHQRLRGLVPFKSAPARNFFASVGCWEKPAEVEEHGRNCVQYVEIGSNNLTCLSQLLP